MQRNLQYVLEGKEEHKGRERRRTQTGEPTCSRPQAQEKGKKHRYRQMKTKQNDADDQSQDVSPDDSLAAQQLLRIDFGTGRKSGAGVEMHRVAGSLRCCRFGPADLGVAG